MPGKTVELKTREEFKRFVSTNKYVIVKASATWCGPCHRIQPVVSEMFAKMPANVQMVLLDVDRGRDLSSYLKVNAVPSFYNYIDGAPQDSYKGCKGEEVRDFFVKTAKHVMGSTGTF